ncbi:MAG: hypothetical protein HGA53_05520, partial [Anaerolineaceae bacterium]|nr:hypothetical protein [Anaerolineaceae bacterium]
MNTAENSYNQPLPKINREKFLFLVNTALRINSYRFARQVCLNWLAVYPMDLGANLLHARSLLAEGKVAQALPIVEKLCKVDPEFIEAHQVLADVHNKIGSGQKSIAPANIRILGGDTDQSNLLPGWSEDLKQAYEYAKLSKFDEADQLLHQVLGSDEDPILAAILHLKITNIKEDMITVLQLAELYNQRWPECLQIKLIYADALMEMGNEVKAVNLLHECAVNDVTGQVPRRLWKEDFPYRPIWPGKLEIFFDAPIPADVAASLGMNQLPAGSGLPKSIPEGYAGLNSEAENILGLQDEDGFEGLFITEKTNDVEGSSSNPPEQPPFEMVAGVGDAVENLLENELVSSSDNKILSESLEPVDTTISEIEAEFERLSKKVKSPSIAREDGRFPIYVVLSIRSSLQKQYGIQSTEIIVKEMASLAESIRNKPGWGGMIYLPDDENC